ncbi:hypothetical protein EV426DRAFT_645891 [Tirmania nivea]|nr:hypothetical protein EV426DRAFT_645891 [Tirmania nivea]
MSNPTKGNLSRKTAPRILAEWTPIDIKNTTSFVSKKNFRLLSSYNWLSEESEFPGPSIVVPGYPPQWNPPKLPQILSPDSGFVIITQNAYRLPQCPIEPLIQALVITQPAFDLNETDLMCDRNILQNLYQFVCRNVHKNFDIGIEMVNNTALFTRLDGATSEVLDPTSRFSGYGHAFEKSFVKISDVMEGMGEHYRIVGYTFGGLNLVVRFITDAYYDATPTTGDMAMQHPIEIRPPAGEVVNEPGTAPMSEYPLADALMDKLVQQLSKLGMEKGIQNELSTKILPALAGSSTSSSGQRLYIYCAGELAPQDNIIELKTTKRDCTPQRWFSNTRHLYIGVHKKGEFTAVVKQTEDDDTIAAWEQSQKEYLGKLAELLGQIVRLGKQNGGRMRITCVKGTLTLQNWDAKDTPGYQVGPLPSELKEKWRVVA